MKLRERIKVGRESGFTLIELLIVVVILGILAAIVTAAVSNARDRAIEESCKAAAATTLRAMDNFYMDNGRWPNVNNTSKAITETLVPKYLKSMPPFTVAQGKVGGGYYFEVTPLGSGDDLRYRFQGFKVGTDTAGADAGTTLGTKCQLGN
ncbi:MAG: type II secretion system protein [Actinomycetota bacterium]